MPTALRTATFSGAGPISDTIDTRQRPSKRSIVECRGVPRSDGHREYWVLLDTAPILDPLATRQEYGLRPNIEERHRQLKCFADLAGFTSRRFSLVVNQVVFVLLMYSLLQWYWQRIRRPEFNARITARALDQLRPTMTVILIFYQGYVARLAPLE
jgi:hypothetical protein